MVSGSQSEALRSCYFDIACEALVCCIGLLQETKERGFSEVAPLLRVAEPRKESGPAEARGSVWHMVLVVYLDSVKSHSLIKAENCIRAARIEASHASTDVSG